MPDNVEKRRHPRYNFTYPIEYVLNPNISGESCKGVIINISNYGVCLCTSNLLTEGQEIKIESILPVSYQTANVRWVEKYDDFYKIGLMFT